MASFWKPGKPQPGNTKGNVQAPPRKGTSLSQKTLAMKFMQRKSKENRNKVREDDSTDTWNIDDTEDGRLECRSDVSDPSIVVTMGRRSFGGYNLAVEAEYNSQLKELRYAESEARELKEEISAEEMAQRMQDYVGIKRFGTNHQRRKTKRQKRE